MPECRVPCIRRGGSGGGLVTQDPCPHVDAPRCGGAPRNGPLGFPTCGMPCGTPRPLAASGGTCGRPGPRALPSGRRQICSAAPHAPSLAFDDYGYLRCGHPGAALTVQGRRRSLRARRRAAVQDRKGASVPARRRRVRKAPALAPSPPGRCVGGRHRVHVGPFPCQGTSALAGGTRRRVGLCRMESIDAHTDGWGRPRPPL